MDGTLSSTSPAYVAVEVKRHAELPAVDQLVRYLEYLNTDPMTSPCRGILAAQSFTPQTITYADKRDIKCVRVDLDELRGMPSNELTLF